MRVACLVAVSLLAAGCATYFVPRQTVDALNAHPSDAENVAVPVLEDGAPAYMRASRLELLPTEAAPAGLVSARARARPRSRPLLIGGLTTLGLGVVLVIAGAAVAAQPVACQGEDFCGFGQAMEAVTIMGAGGALGLVGIPLAAVGGSSTSPTVPTGEPGIVYLPR